MRGTNIHPVWWDPAKNPSIVTDRVAAMKRDGITHVRFDAPWWMIEPTKGQWDTIYKPRLDAAVKALAAAGIQMLCVFTGAPAWASGRSDTVQAPPLVKEQYNASIGRLLLGWAPAQVHVEVWNEAAAPTIGPITPKNQGNWVGGTVRQYGEQLRYCRRYVKELRGIPAGVQVLGGSIHDPTSAEAKAWFSMLLQLGYFVDLADGVSLHIYKDGGVHGTGWPYEVIRDGKRFMAGTGLRGHITETGWHTGQGGCDYEKQAYAHAETRAQLDRQDPDRLLLNELIHEYEFFDDKPTGSSSAQEDCYGTNDSVTLRPKTAA